MGRYVSCFGSLVELLRTLQMTFRVPSSSIPSCSRDNLWDRGRGDPALTSLIASPSSRLCAKLIRQVLAAETSSPARVGSWVRSGGLTLALRQNLRIHAVTRTNVENDECFSTKSGRGQVMVRHVDLVSGGFRMSAFKRGGHWSGGMASHGGPFHHSTDLTSVEAYIPLLRRSAGFWSVPTCLQLAGGRRLAMSLTLLATNVCRR